MLLVRSQALFARGQLALLRRWVREFGQLVQRRLSRTKIKDIKLSEFYHAG